MTNEQRTDAAYSAMLAYGHRKNGVQPSANEMEEVITDLLTDFLHMADAYGLDLDKHLETAKMHYEAEIEEEPCL